MFTYRMLTSMLLAFCLYVYRGGLSWTWQKRLAEATSTELSTIIVMKIALHLRCYQIIYCCIIRWIFLTVTGFVRKLRKEEKNISSCFIRCRNTQRKWRKWKISNRRVCCLEIIFIPYVCNTQRSSQRPVKRNIVKLSEACNGICEDTRKKSRDSFFSFFILRFFFSLLLTFIVLHKHACPAATTELWLISIHAVINLFSVCVLRNNAIYG